jgi:hypothetical protein
MTPLFSSYIKVDCPDGPRYILKNPEKAFAISFPDWNIRVRSLIRFFSISEANVGAEIFKRTEAMVKDLTENYAALQAHYQAAYLGWSGNPCSKIAEKKYNDVKAMICRKEFYLKVLESKTSELAKRIETDLGQEMQKQKQKNASRKEKKDERST